MNINTFSIFLTVVEEMNFTKAAQRLGITQQSLSGHVKHLEEEYGVTLFERRPTLKLTAEGESMVFYANLIVQAQNSMCNEFADLSMTNLANLDIGMSSMRCSYIGKEIWRKFHSLHPNIRVRFVESNTNTLLELLHTGDIRIMAGLDIRQVPGLRVIPVLKEQMYFVVSKELYHRYYPEEPEKEQGSRISISQVKEIPVFLPVKGTRMRMSMERMYRAAGFMPKILCESARQTMMYHMVQQGEGASILSPMVFLDWDGVFRLPEDLYVFRILEIQPSVVGVAYLTDVQLTHYEEEMIEIIREKYLRYGEAIVQAGLKQKT